MRVSESVAGEPEKRVRGGDEGRGRNSRSVDSCRPLLSRKEIFSGSKLEAGLSEFDDAESYSK